MNVELPNWRRVLNVLLVVVFVLLLVPFVLVLASSFVGGFESYVVLSDSMSPRIKTGDMVFVRDVPASSIHEGDVITYRPPGSTQTVTHAVVDVRQQDGGTVFKTKGAANEEADPYVVPADRVIGKELFHVPYLGRIVNFMKTETGILAFIIVPAVLLVVTEIADLILTARRSGSSSGGSASDGSGDGGGGAPPGEATGSTAPPPREEPNPPDGGPADAAAVRDGGAGLSPNGDGSIGSGRDEPDWVPQMVDDTVGPEAPDADPETIVWDDLYADPAALTGGETSGDPDTESGATGAEDAESGTDDGSRDGDEGVTDT